MLHIFSGHRTAPILNSEVDDAETLSDAALYHDTSRLHRYILNIVKYVWISPTKSGSSNSITFTFIFHLLIINMSKTHKLG